MLERTDTITNEVLEPIMFILAYPTVLKICCIHIVILHNISLCFMCSCFTVSYYVYFLLHSYAVPVIGLFVAVSTLITKQTLDYYFFFQVRHSCCVDE